MKKAKPPGFGRKGPVIYEESYVKTRKKRGKLHFESRSYRAVRLPWILCILLLAGFILLPDESRAAAKTVVDFLIETAKSWIFRGSLD